MKCLKNLIDFIIESLKKNAVCMFTESIELGLLTDCLNMLAKRKLALSPSDFLGEPNSLTPRNWLSYGHPSYDLPLHTDYPDYAIPPRFVLLKCHSVGSIPVETVFYDVGVTALSHHRCEVLLNEPWLTTGGVEKSRVVRLLEIDFVSEAPRLRYATNVMRPFFRASSSGQEVLSSIVNRIEPVGIVLTPGETVIWDNWRVLHGRRTAEVVPQKWSVGTERVLERLKWT